jgi:hypothetical protein
MERSSLQSKNNTFFRMDGGSPLLGLTERGSDGEMWSRYIVSSPTCRCQCLFLAGVWMVRSAMSVQSWTSPASKVSLPVLQRMALLDLHFLLATLTSLPERASCSVRPCPCPRSVAIGKSGADEKTHKKDKAKVFAPSLVLIQSDQLVQTT